MGLSSSQGRLLMLTSRLSDIEMQETMLSQRQNQLAMQRELETKEYMKAVNNYKLTINVTDADQEGGFHVEDLTYENMTKMGYLIANANNQIYLKKDENGKWIIPKDINNNDICSVNEATNKAIIKGKEYDLVEGTQTLKNNKVIQNCIINGTLFVIDVQKENPQISKNVLEGDTNMNYVLDTSDDAEAESKHEYETARLERQENQLELDIKQLETQHEAVLKEYDSVKEVISNNVNRTFKLFSSNG